MGAGQTYKGGCHCGAVRFRVTVQEWIAIECNCSMCAMKGYLHIIVDSHAFVLEQGGEMLTTYTFHTHVLIAGFVLVALPGRQVAVKPGKRNRRWCMEPSSILFEDQNHRLAD